MDFDFRQIAVPFRMQPGLRRMAVGERHLTPLDPASALYGEKLRVVQAGASRLAVAGFDAAPALRAIAREGGMSAGAAHDPHWPELAFEEDLAVLDGTNGTLAWLAACVPSHWAPEEKLGLSLAAIHAPVADNAALLAASDSLVRLATGGERWERHVWTVTPDARHDQHPQRQSRTPWPDIADPAAFAAQCWLRVERQTFFPVDDRGAPRQAVFTIRVMLQPLAEAVGTREQALRLHGSLASMSDAALAYKNLAPARDRLLAWLQTGSS